MVNYLREGLLTEIYKARDLIATCNELPDYNGSRKASLIRTEIEDAEKAILERDTLQMLISFKRLKFNDWTLLKVEVAEK